MRASITLLLASLLLAEASARYLLQPQNNGLPAPETLLGARGNNEQCAAHRGGSNLSVGAFARCGEDGPREYRILLQLSQGDLRIN